MTTIRDVPLNCPEATYVEPVYKEAGMRNFTNLVRTMLNDYGVYHVQFNTINKETLIDAKAHPENYPTLMVRVAGYSVYWTDIAERVQDDIINRTEHTFGGRSWGFRCAGLPNLGLRPDRASGAGTREEGMVGCRHFMDRTLFWRCGGPKFFRRAPESGG